MKRLPETFMKNSYKHVIIWRDADYAITEVRDEHTNKLYCLEAFEIQKHKETTIKGSLVEAREATPSNEEWGIKGFTVSNMTDAQLKIGFLRSNKINPQNKKRK